MSQPEIATKTAYRTTHPDALAAWRSAADAREEWGKQMDAFLAEHGLSGRTVWVSHSGRVFGIEHVHDTDVPEGWRIDSRTGHLMPRLAKKAGKLIDARLDELKQPDPRDAMPGMPKDCFVSLALLTCGLALLGEALYATWSRPIPEEQVDLTIWERIKLSEYYAAWEAHEAEQERQS
ncbi:hypothetical protein ETD86_37070 [Nonomuraea turkmeniaca]|uniref:Uncharacterized protein n=1 Tax=Nonomuraea turkmeniaca TaxID=103838 RepID=A0A5S4F4S8_9ACTN|nr:hypothetical protein [Nonomuraea turkmeniaca]TMR11058.1 hypothetical protein ETD86_37070 [Nonomuraea turkmeniaca]